MSFQTDIEAITGSISSYTTEANSYLVEGVKFITKYVMNNIDIEAKLTQSTTLDDSPTTLSTANVLRISSVARYDGSRSRECVEINSSERHNLDDVNSIYYTSKFDPKYYVLDSTLNIFPTPTASQTASVVHITPDTSVAVSDSSIDNFPTELNRGVVLYASQQVLRKFLNVRNATLTDLSTGLNSISPPTGDDLISTIIYNGPDNADVGNGASASSVSNNEAISATQKIDLGTAPLYDSSNTSAVDFTTANIGVDAYLTNEDVELAGVALSKASQQLQDFQADIQVKVNEFNEANTSYQANIQAELDKAQRDLQALIADAQNDLTAARETAQLATNVSIQNQAEKSQRLIQNAINEMQAIVADNQNNIAKYSADLNKYQAEVNEAVQEYQLSFQEVVQDYNWLAQQYQIVSQDLVTFLQPYIPIGVPNEVAADDRAS
jgi:hypothetical protein